MAPIGRKLEIQEVPQIDEHLLLIAASRSPREQGTIYVMSPCCRSSNSKKHHDNGSGLCHWRLHVQTPCIHVQQTVTYLEYDMRRVEEGMNYHKQESKKRYFTTTKNRWAHQRAVEPHTSSDTCSMGVGSPHAFAVSCVQIGLSCSHVGTGRCPRVGRKPAPPPCSRNPWFAPVAYAGGGRATTRHNSEE